MDYLVTIHTEYGDMKLVLYDSTPIHKENFLKLARSKAYDNTIFHRVINNFMIQGGDLSSKEGTPPADSTLPAEFHKPYFHRKGAVAAARTSNPEKRSSISQFYIVHGAPIKDTRTLTVDPTALRYGLRGFLANPAHEAKAKMLDSLSRTGTEAEYADYIYGLVPEIEKEMSLSLKKDLPEKRLEVYTKVGGVPHLDEEYTVFGQVVEGIEVVDKIAAVSTDSSDKPKKPVTMSIEVEEIAQEELRMRYDLDEQMRLK